MRKTKEQALEDVFTSLVDLEAVSSSRLRARVQDFVFHICDFGDELSEFARCVESIDRKDPEESAMEFLKFFNHALNHLEAARLLAVPDHENPFLAVQPVLKEVEKGEDEKGGNAFF